MLIRFGIIAAFLAVCGPAQSRSDTKGPFPRPAWESRYQALSMPAPDYPYEARRRHLSGSGIIAVEVDHETGLVKAATIKMSTGSALLDQAALHAAKQWRFRPPAVVHLDVPVSFTIARVTLG
jgi:TonB family protein